MELVLFLLQMEQQNSKTNGKHYVPKVTLSTLDNGKLLQQLKSGFKRTINWNKYYSKVGNQI